MDLNACWSFIFLGVCLILIKRYQIKGVCYTLIKRWLVSLIFQVIPTLYLIQVTASSLPTVGMMSYINLMSSTTAQNQVKYAFNSLNSNFSLVKWPVPLEDITNLRCWVGLTFLQRWDIWQLLSYLERCDVSVLNSLVNCFYILVKIFRFYFCLIITYYE